MHNKILYIFCLQVFFITFYTYTYSQGVYYKLGLQKSISTNKDYIFMQNLNDNKIIIHGSYGAGFAANTAIGYLLANNLGFEIEAQYMYKSKSIKCISNDQVIPSGPVVNVNYKHYSRNCLFIRPSLIHYFSEKKLKYYLKLGGQIPIISSMISNYKSQGSDNSEYEIKYTFYITPGAFSTIGLQYQLRNNIHVWADLSYTLQNIYIKKSTITKRTATINGVEIDYLASYTISQKERIYKKEYTVTNNTPSDTNQPSIAITRAFPFSNIAFNIGVAFSFVK